MIDVILFCLAWNVYFEARGEPIEGQREVANVTILRADLSGRNICEEVFLDRQFSWNNGDIRPVVTNEKAWKEALNIASSALITPPIPNYGSTHYHAIRFNGRLFPKPKWAYKLCETTRIGNHIFYKQCEVNK